jgi:putative transposase
LSDANRRRPSAIFAEAVAQLSAMASCSLLRYSKEVLWLIDATPIPLTSLHKWANWNGRTRGLKTHVIYDPRCRPAGASRDYRGHGQRHGGRAVNRSSREFFDKAYADYAWWQRLHEAGCCFVTGPKAMYRCASSQSGRSSSGRDRSDTVVELALQQRLRLPIALRRIMLRRDDGRRLTILSNDLQRSAGALATLA